MNCKRALELAKRIRKAEMVKGVNRPDGLTRRNNRLLYIRVWDYSTTLHAPAVQVIWTWNSGTRQSALNSCVLSLFSLLHSLLNASYFPESPCLSHLTLKGIM